MKNLLVFILLLSIALVVAACGGTTPNAPTSQISTGQEPAATALPPADEAVATEPDTSPAADTGCEDFFLFCVTSTISGAVDATATAGMGGHVDDCAAWVAEGESRILDMPMMQGAGEEPITVALTRIGQYTGPGSYELVPVATQGMPDMFPTLVVAGRTFSNGEGSAAVVTVAPDGSGTVEATGLVEIASIQVSDPDPDARIDFNMQWTCRDN